MAINKISPTEQVLPTYEAQMSALRLQLNGRPYCKGVKDLVPELTKAQIHGAVAGRNENELVLAALKIVVADLERAEKAAQKRLSELTEKLQEMEVAE
jgi:hypothetical protein